MLSSNQCAPRFSGPRFPAIHCSMTIEIPETPTETIPTEEVASPRVSIIFEDAASALRARQSLGRLARNLNVEAEVFALRMWSFDLLSDPGLRRQAAREAADYKIIFLSLRDSSEPPAVLKAWLGEWLKCRTGQTCALAVLLDEKEQTTARNTPLLSYLSGVAEAGGLDLVYPCLEKPEPQINHENIRQIARRAINASPLLEGIVDDWESYLHSGINE